MNYYQQFINGYVELSRPIYGLMHNPRWIENCETSFQEFNQILPTTPILRTPILRAPNCSIEFYVHTDASAYAISNILTQPGEHKLDYPIYFGNRQLDVAERNYNTTKREELAMIFNCKKYRHYLLANDFKFYIDHQALLYLVNKTCTKRRITRWLLFLQEFDFEIFVRK